MQSKFLRTRGAWRTLWKTCVGLLPRSRLLVLVLMKSTNDPFPIYYYFAILGLEVLMAHHTVVCFIVRGGQIYNPQMRRINIHYQNMNARKNFIGSGVHILWLQAFTNKVFDFLAVVESHFSFSTFLTWLTPQVFFFPFRGLFAHLHWTSFVWNFLALSDGATLCS